MKRKIRYALLDDVEQTVIVLEDRSLATVHFNDEFIVVNWYSNTVPIEFDDNNIDDAVWKYLDEGWRYWKEFYLKKEIDEEVISFALDKLYGDVFEFEKDTSVGCFCKNDLQKFFFTS